MARAAGVLLALAVSVMATGAADVAPDGLDADECEALAGIEIAPKRIDLLTIGARVTSATFVTDGGGRCEVVGDILPLDPDAPAIEFQVNLPVEWNRRAVQFGGAGYDGTLVTGLGHYARQPTDQPTPIEQGFVTLGSDGGHRGDADDASFARNDEALRNFGHESIKKTHDVAMALMRDVYERAPEFFYFVGFGQGGKEALDAAGRYSEDYDGVIAGAPAYNVTMLHAGVGSMYRDALYRDGGVGWLNPAETRRVVEAVYDTCDPLDGLIDGIVSDTEGCLEIMDPLTLLCPEDVDPGATDECLSAAQVDTVRMIAAGKDLGVAVAGERLAPPGPILMGGTYDRFTLGTVSQPSNPRSGGEAFHYTTLDAIVKHIITLDPAHDTTDFQLREWIPRIREVGRILDTTDVDFAHAVTNTKVLLFTGLSDDAIPPVNTIRFSERLVEELGRREVDRFLRFFTIPGFGHGDGPFAATFDSLAVLQAWVERGETPEDLTVTDANPATRGRERPLCEYPAWPRYVDGDPDAADSFTCVTR